MSNRNSSWGRPPEVEAILAIGSLALFGYVTYAVIWHTVPADNEKYAMLMLGALIGVVKDTFGRYFQATKGAQEQRKEAADVAAKAADTAATLAAQIAPVGAAPKSGTADISAAADVDVTITKKVPEPAAPRNYDRGTVPTIADLPLTDNVVGDFYVLMLDGHKHIWNGALWIDNGLAVPPEIPAGV